MTRHDRDEPSAERRESADGAHDRGLRMEAIANTFRPWAGWVFYAFGAVFVLLGYLGISREAVVAKQLPYLISGGIGGVLLAVLGAYLLGIEELRKDSGRLDRLERQIDELHRALLARPDAPTHGTEAASASIDNGVAAGQLLVAVPSGSSFHRDSCALVAGKSMEMVDPGELTERGLTPCKVCEPSLVP